MGAISIVVAVLGTPSAVIVAANLELSERFEACRDTGVPIAQACAAPQRDNWVLTLVAAAVLLIAAVTAVASRYLSTTSSVRGDVDPPSARHI